MKRLTGRKENGCAYIIGCPDFEIPKIVGLIIQRVVDKCADIEDILGDDYDLSRLRDLVQADMEGRCVVLPCKVGERLWCINSYGEVEETSATGFLIGKGLVCIYYREKMSSEYYNAPLGKILFLTREAAEKALEEEKYV